MIVFILVFMNDETKCKFSLKLNLFYVHAYSPELKFVELLCMSMNSCFYDVEIWEEAN